MRDVLTDEYMAWCSGGRRGGGRKLGGLKIGQDEAHQQNLFYYSVMQYPIIVNEQFFINHQFRLQY